MVDYTVSGMVDYLKKTYLLPNGVNTFGEQQICDILNTYCQSYAAIVYKAQIQEFLIETHYVDLTDSNEYTIPHTAMGAELRDFALIDQQGNPKYCSRIDPSQIKSYGVGNSVSGNNYPVHYYENDKVVLWWGSVSANNNNHSGEFTGAKFTIYRSPNQLVLREDAAQIESINGNVITLSNRPVAWDTDTMFDFIKGKRQFTGKGVEQMDGWSINDLSGLVMTFDEVPDNLEIGDWISETGTSPIAMIPYEAHKGFLVAKAAQMMLTSLSKPQAAAVGKQADEFEQALLKIMPRNDAQPVQLNHRNSIRGR